MAIAWGAVFRKTRATADAAQQPTQATRASKWKEFFQEPLLEKIARWKGKWKTCRRNRAKKRAIAREYREISKDYRKRAEELLPETLRTKENVVKLARFLATNHDFRASWSELNKEMRTFFENYAHKWNAVTVLVLFGEIAIRKHGTTLDGFKCFNLLAQNGFKDTNLERIANSLASLLEKTGTPRELYKTLVKLVNEGRIRKISDLERLSAVDE